MTDHHHRELDAFKLRSPLASTPIPGRALCVSMYEDFVYLGLDNGSVVSYTIESKRPGKKEEDRKWTEVTRKKISKKAINQMEIIDPFSTVLQSINSSSTQNSKAAASADQAYLFVLADGRLLALHPHTLDVLIDFSSLKVEISLFALDLRSPHHLAVHHKLKKKLSLYSYSLVPNLLDITKNKCELIRELPLSTDQPLSLGWASDWICVGYRNKYILLHCSSSEIREIPVPIEGACPVIHIMSSSEMLLSSNNELGFFINFKGELSPRNPVAWGNSPFKMNQVDQYIIGLFTEEPYHPPTHITTGAAAVPPPPQAIPQSTASAQFTSIRIASLLDQRIVQTLPIPNPITATSNKDKLILLTNSGDLFSLILVSLEEQIQQYMDLSLTEEALSLLLRTKPDAAKLADFHITAGFVLLKDLQFQAAFQHFLQSNVDPRELIGLFNDLVFKQFLYERKRKVGVIDEIIEKGRKKAEQRSEDRRYKAILALSSKQLQQQARLLLAGFLWERRRKNQLHQFEDRENLIAWVDTVLLYLAIEFADEAAISQPTSATSSPIATPKSTAASPANPTILSTSAFPFTLQQLLFPSNHCVVGDCETYLIVKHHYNALALLYESIDEPRKALEVWMRMGSGEFLEKDSSQQSAGMTETVNLLSELNDDPLIWEFAEWVLLEDSTAGLCIFTSNKRKAPLSHEKVLQYLRKVSTKRPPIAKEKEDISDIVETYLEHIVLKGKIKDPSYHTQLAVTYIKKIFALQQAANPQAATVTSSAVAPPATEGEKEKKKKKKKDKAAASAAQHSGPLTAAYLHRPKPGSEPPPLGPLRRKLYQFLQTSSYYDASAAVAQLLTLVWPKESRSQTDDPDAADPMWIPSPMELAYSEIGMIEEMILLFAKLQQHKKVLHLFVYGLRDHIGAAHYCLQVAKQNARVAAQEMAEKLVRESTAKKELKEKEDNSGFNNKNRLQQNQRKQQPIAAVDDDDQYDDDDDDNAALRRRRRKEAAERRQREEADRLALAEQEAAQKQEELEEDLPHPGDVFLILIDLYFTDDFFKLFATAEEQQAVTDVPPPTAYQSAVDILSLYHPYIDPVKAIKGIPPWVPLPALRPLFSALIPRTLHQRRHAQIVKQLERTHHLSVELLSINTRSASFQLDSQYRCPHCKKPIGDAIIAAVPIQPHQPDYNIAIIPQKRSYDEDEVKESKTAANPEDEETAIGYVIVHYQCSQGYVADLGKRGGATQEQSHSQQRRGSESHSSTSNNNIISSTASTASNSSASAGRRESHQGDLDDFYSDRPRKQSIPQRKTSATNPFD